jgi:NADPH:quinone reductase-like Zn-dependent oxidoreductase
VRALTTTSTVPYVTLADVADVAPRLPDQELVRVRPLSVNRGEVTSLPRRAEGFFTEWDAAGVVERAAPGASGTREGGTLQFAAIPTTADDRPR